MLSKAELREAFALIGNFSKTDKMPGLSWGVPASACKTGSKLAKVAGTTCSRCYARKGRYVFGSVKNANSRRLEAWRANRRQWREWARTFAAALDAVDDSGYFRFFDTGDIQDLDMLRAICLIAELSPARRFWLPTQEGKLVLRYVETGGKVPPNLTIRLSLERVDDHTRPALADLLGLPTSSASTDASRVTCPAKLQNNRCLACRACWSPDVRHVVYAAH